MSNLRLNLSVLFIFALVSFQFGASSGSQSNKEAYVTLLYGDEFVLGVRVLGKSIRNTGSKKDMVVLVSDGVSDYSKRLLKADGWIVEKISLLANPNQVHPKRFWGVYTKLKIFNMTAYRKVVYLDADTIVVKSIEDLFKCSKFCANLKHSERLNSGVMVVEPSEALFNDMMSKMSTMSSYTGGDQGFLNSYYPDFPSARVFDPTLSLEEMKLRPAPKMERLSTLYNADVGLYMLANKWMVDDSQLRVIHYTLGPLKPWDWWTSWLVKPVDAWQSIRVQVEDSLPGTGRGKNSTDELIVKLLIILPFCALLFCCYPSVFQAQKLLASFPRSSPCNQIRHLYYKIRSNRTLGYTGVSTMSSVHSNYQLSSGPHAKIPPYLGVLSIVVCLLAAVMSLGLSFVIVPHQIMPWTGLLLMCELSFTIFLLSYGGFLLMVYRCGTIMAIKAGSSSSQPESSLDDSGKGHQRTAVSCDTMTWFYGLGMAVLIIVTLSLPYIFGVTALFVRLGLMVAGALVLVSFMTYAAEHLAVRWFLRGFEDRNLTRTRSLCLIC